MQLACGLFIFTLMLFNCHFACITGSVFSKTDHICMLHVSFCGITYLLYSLGNTVSCVTWKHSPPGVHVAQRMKKLMLMFNPARGDPVPMETLICCAQNAIQVLVGVSSVGRSDSEQRAAARRVTSSESQRELIKSIWHTQAHVEQFTHTRTATH